MGAAPMGTSLPVTGSSGSWGSRTLPPTPPPSLRVWEQSTPEASDHRSSEGSQWLYKRGSGSLHLKAIAIFKTLQVHSTFLCLGARDRLGGRLSWVWTEAVM
ncbi:unnamed protein product [Rangifer tarandus platyrhynchus]|uniref:Uncharacterized protein n=2 Tax=Rangifer tarandus platyrhynchus TaxID=3082113 RepID=A0AC59YHD0_RANTA|nr:unnamed protein product [Rangifer tarandus platyrhynchus]